MNKHGRIHEINILPPIYLTGQSGHCRLDGVFMQPLHFLTSFLINGARAQLFLILVCVLWHRLISKKSIALIFNQWL
ncbi:MAG: hypothetical protein DIZ80_04650 [endosymbiont of Galathealinum brachiosum]|uniref:Uncharacterized protein n=1 Tax=endosymbiont of Galathealinum brachiosum TaxID=2200906 RepID=A0A370DIP8_9GAMM|nr:MAG: hypothetical protein DIZ80_04650 [endosymbiont of Galathealinum brachiosum]